MNFQRELVIFIIGACSLISLTKAVCVTPKCFDCTTCIQNCSQPQQGCDSDCIGSVKEFLCNMEVENCIKTQGCDVPPSPIAFYPAANFDVSQPEWQPETIQARKNCCYQLTGIYDNTLSAFKTNGACMILYDNSDCTGANIQISSNTSAACLAWIDCPDRINAGGIPFNDRASSFQLC